MQVSRVQQSKPLLCLVELGWLLQFTYMRTFSEWEHVGGMVPKDEYSAL